MSLDDEPEPEDVHDGIIVDDFGDERSAPRRPPLAKDLIPSIRIASPACRVITVTTKTHPSRKNLDEDWEEVELVDEIEAPAPIDDVAGAQAD